MFENGIRSLSRDSFLGLPALQLLDLSQNLLSSLPQNVFQPLTGIYNLDLSSNQLREISNESFHGLRWLERLYLDHNRLEFIHPAAFDTLEHLLELKLQDNRLQAMPPLRLPTLLLLDISRNGIAALEPAAFHVRNLESLKIAGLGLRSLPEQLLQDLQNLHELDLSDNLLAAVPGALKRLHGLTKLSLAGNAQIAQLHLEDFRELRSLQELDISNLNLNGLPRDFFSAFPRLRGVTAAENPFNCVCQMSWFISWASSSGASLRRPEETRCHFPPQERRPAAPGPGVRGLWVPHHHHHHAAHHHPEGHQPQAAPRPPERWAGPRGAWHRRHHPRGQQPPADAGHRPARPAEPRGGAPVPPAHLPQRGRLPAGPPQPCGMRLPGGLHGPILRDRGAGDHPAGGPHPGPHPARGHHHPARGHHLSPRGPAELHPGPDAAEGPPPDVPQPLRAGQAPRHPQPARLAARLHRASPEAQLLLPPLRRAAGGPAPQRGPVRGGTHPAAHPPAARARHAGQGRRPDAGPGARPGRRPAAGGRRRGPLLLCEAEAAAAGAEGPHGPGGQRRGPPGAGGGQGRSGEGGADRPRAQGRGCAQRPGIRGAPHAATATGKLRRHATDPRAVLLLGQAGAPIQRLVPGLSTEESPPGTRT
uniref:Vasorin n=1 Tax=Varanus komodoensis TaxID=61221 RepID=A0A8D2J9V8_VARKO